MATIGDPSTLFVDFPYVLGSDRSHQFTVETENENGSVQQEDITGDRIEIHVAKRFADADDTDVLRFSSAGGSPAILLAGATQPNGFTWTISRKLSLPTGELQWRCWWIKDPDTENELREVLWTEPFHVTR